MKTDYQNSFIGRGLMAYMQYNKDVDRLSEDVRTTLERLLNLDVLSTVKDQVNY